MKTLKNEKLVIAGNETDYKALIESALNQTPEGGFTFDEIRKRNKIQEVLDKSNGKINFEDAQAEDLKRIVKQARWLLRDKAIEIFGDDVEKL